MSEMNDGEASCCGIARRKSNNESRERPISIYGENVRATQPIADSSRFHRTFKPHSRHLRNAMNSRGASFLFLSTISVLRQWRRGCEIGRKDISRKNYPRQYELSSISESTDKT